MANKQRAFNSVARFSSFFIRRYRISITLFLLLAAFGLLSYTTLLRREGFPPVNVPVAVISGRFPVNSSRQVDNQVVQPVLSAIRAGTGSSAVTVDTIRSMAGNNFFSITVEFAEITEAAAGTRFLQEQVETANLPPQAQLDIRAIQADKFNEKYHTLISLFATGADIGTEELQQKARKLSERLEAQAFIAEAEPQDIIIDRELRGGQTVRQQVGFNRIGLRTAQGIEFFPAIIIGVVQAGNLDNLELSDRISGVLAEINQSADFRGFQAVLSADFAPSIRQQIADLQESLLIGLLAVIIVAFLLLSWRASFILALFIPVTLLITFGILFLIGYTLNTITLFALILTLGLFVDDATVIVEAIDAKSRTLPDRRKAILAAIQMVGRASIAGTLTTLLVFVPMTFVSGVLGDFIRIMPITVIIGLAASIFISLSFIPLVALWIMRGAAEGKAGKHTALHWIGRAEQAIGRRLERNVNMLNRPGRKGLAIAVISIVVSIASVATGAWYATKTGFDIFPVAKDVNSLQLVITYPPGSSIGTASEIADTVNRTIDDAIGAQVERVVFLEANERGAELQIDLVPLTDRSVKSPVIEQQLRAALEGIRGARLRVSPIAVGPPREEFPLQIRLITEDAEQPLAAARAVAAFLEGQEIRLRSGKRATITETAIDSPDTITRINGDRFLTVLGRFSDTAHVSGFVNAAETLVTETFTPSRLQELGLEAGDLQTDVGQEAENQQSFQSAVAAFFIALLGVIIVLVWQFSSIMQPLLIVLAIPLSALGVFAGLYYTNNPISFFVLIGLISLVGISVNNTIMLTDIANQYQRSGMLPVNAMAAAIRDRFRPLVATTATTVFGLLPLALTDPFWESLALTIIFGLLSSTLFVIIAFPYFYLVVEWLRHKTWKILKFPGNRDG